MATARVEQRSRREVEVHAREQNPVRIRRIQLQQGEEPCCGTEKRYFCNDYRCPWHEPCHRLRAVWRH